MKLFASVGTAATIAAALLFSAPPAPAAAYASPIQIVHCSIMKPRPMSTKPRGTAITYINRGPKTATQIKFAVGYINSENPRGLLRTVTDVGTMSPGATINRNFSLYSDVTYSGAQTHGCEAVKVTWADGSVWVAGR